MAQREELLSFLIPGFDVVSLGFDTGRAQLVAKAMQDMHTWVNDRLARGGRVKHMTQTSAATEHHAGSLVTVVIEYPEHA